MKIENAFLKTIQHLWAHEEILIFNEKVDISRSEEKDCLLWLEAIYDDVALSFPNTNPNFDGEAALWAAKLLYYSAHFIVHRQNSLKELPEVLSAFLKEITPSCLTSADLFLKFLPQVCNELRRIDHEDVVLAFLEDKILSEWIFSSVGYLEQNQIIQLDLILKDPCLKALFLNRIIERKDNNWIRHPKVFELVTQMLGQYQGEVWEELKWVDEHHNIEQE